MIILSIKRKWFDLIKCGAKAEEYREIKPYYTSRFKAFLKCYTPIHVRLKNAYKKDSPYIDVLCQISIGKGFEKWGAKEGKDYYILHIEKVYDSAARLTKQNIGCV